jgi:3-hydroxyisobutyrate dehydrogenase-like beta-hydroxyacid dehydrogenase
MARRIIEAGYPLTLWARRVESFDPFADTKATCVAEPADLGAASEIVCICVTGDDDVEQVASTGAASWSSIRRCIPRPVSDWLVSLLKRESH